MAGDPSSFSTDGGVGGTPGGDGKKPTNDRRGPLRWFTDGLREGGRDIRFNLVERFPISLSGIFFLLSVATVLFTQDWMERFIFSIRMGTLSPSFGMGVLLAFECALFLVLVIVARREGPSNNSMDLLVLLTVLITVCNLGNLMLSYEGTAQLWLPAGLILGIVSVQILVVRVWLRFPIPWVSLAGLWLLFVWQCFAPVFAALIARERADMLIGKCWMPWEVYLYDATGLSLRFWHLGWLLPIPSALMLSSPLLRRQRCGRGRAIPEPVALAGMCAMLVSGGVLVLGGGVMEGILVPRHGIAAYWFVAAPAAAFLCIAALNLVQAENDCTRALSRVFALAPVLVFLATIRMLRWGTLSGAALWANPAPLALSVSSILCAYLLYRHARKSGRSDLMHCLPPYSLVLAVGLFARDNAFSIHAMYALFGLMFAASLFYYGYVLDQQLVSLSGAAFCAFLFFNGGTLGEIYPFGNLKWPISLFVLGVGVLSHYCLFRKHTSRLIAVLGFAAMFLWLGIVLRSGYQEFHVKAWFMVVLASCAVIVITRDPFLLCTVIPGGILCLFNGVFNFATRFFTHLATWQWAFMSFVLLGIGLLLSLSPRRPRGKPRATATGEDAGEKGEAR